MARSALLAREIPRTQQWADQMGEKKGAPPSGSDAPLLLIRWCGVKRRLSNAVNCRMTRLIRKLKDMRRHKPEYVAHRVVVFCANICFEINVLEEGCLLRSHATQLFTSAAFRAELRCE